MAWVALVALLGAGFAYAALGREEETAEQAPELFTSTLDTSECVWWTYAGPAGAAVANLGPILSSKDSAVRRYSLIVHFPGTSEPLTCIQGLVPVSDRNPIGIQGGAFLVELLPKDGLAWGDVMSPQLIDASVSGISENPPRRVESLTR
jgi:hypothetical protein